VVRRFGDGRCQSAYRFRPPRGCRNLCRGGSRPYDLCDLLRDHPIAAGDVFFLPAGRVHSIGAGAFIAEIQQTSDLTYRIYDYDRPGPDGRPRELHTELAKEAIDYTVPDDYRTHYERIRNKDTELVACPYFTTHLCDATFSVLCDYSALDSFVVLIFVAGAGELVDSEGNRVAVRQGETVLIPASTRQVTLLPGHGGLRFLSSYIERPKSSRSFRSPECRAAPFVDLGGGDRAAQYLHRLFEFVGVTLHARPLLAPHDDRLRVRQKRNPRLR